MKTLTGLFLLFLISVFFILGLISVAVIMNHFAPIREIHVILPGRYRRLNPREQRVQHRRGMLYCIEEPIRVSFMYDGRREVVTVPAGRVFDGDSLKRLMGFGSSGIAWVVHDWLYRVPNHVLDSGIEIRDHRHADEIMYELLGHEGVIHMVYASILRLFDDTISSTLNRAWHQDTGSNVFVSD
jgi:hypothetical protein